MTVRTDEFALLDFGQHGTPTKPPQVADLIHLLTAWKVVPSHGGMVEVPAAISTGLAFLEFVVPTDNVLPALTLPRLKPRTRHPKVAGIV
jgi:hypothetical protein